MPYDCVVAVYKNYDKAHVGLQVLDMRGFTADSVSVISGSDQEKIVQSEWLRRRQDAPASSSEQGDTRAAYFSLVAAQTILGMALGPLLVVGPLAALAFGGGVAAVRSIGSAINPQVPEGMGRTYEQFLRDGCVLVIVYASGDQLIEAASGLKTTDTLSLETYRVDAQSEQPQS
ncbi:MAG: hypothetical protein ACTHK7_06655 [Aureliella sp.]